MYVNVQDVARRLAPQPFVGGGYSYLGETFNPPLTLLVSDEEGYRLLESARHGVGRGDGCRGLRGLSLVEPELPWGLAARDRGQHALGVHKHYQVTIGLEWQGNGKLIRLRDCDSQKCS